MTTLIPCSGVSQLLIFVSCNVFKIVWLEWLPIRLSTHTSLSIGCLLNTIPHLRLPYWCISFYIVAIQNTLYLSLNLNIVFVTQVIPLSPYKWYVPWLQVIIGGGTASQVAPSHPSCSHYRRCNSRLYMFGEMPLSFKYHSRFACDHVSQW